MFRKKDDAGAPEAPAAAAPAAPPAAAAVDWNSRLQAAAGDDDALFALARGDAPLAAKLAAVDAIAGEATLKLAEREFREHDRRVHRLAKQRHAACVAQREARAQAARLLADARALTDEPLIAVNQVVELDRAWQRLDPGLLDAAHRDEFATLLSGLGASTRGRAEEVLALKRWQAEAGAALQQLQATLVEAARGTRGRGDLATGAAAARGVLGAAPAGEAAAAACAALQMALQQFTAVDERLAWIDALPPAIAPIDDDAAAANGSPVGEATRRWQQMAPLADPALGEPLDLRFERWRQAHEEVRQAHRDARRERAREQQRARRGERGATLVATLELAEAALSAGHLADAERHLVEIDGLAHDGAPATAVRARIDAAQADYARLKGWQHWGGGRARDELAQAAEALATLTAGEAVASIPKLSLRQRAEVIDDMRARWKELDRLGGATSRALWQRFDAALKTAYAPVAAQAAAQRAAREQNLLARQALIEGLDAVAAPEAGADAAPDWKALAATIDHFQLEWRRLGPVEHTVPKAAHARLVERMTAALARLEAPLNEVRRAATLEREQLVGRARALAAEAGAGAPGRDLGARVRELQAQWQQQAKALPLSRAAESALWADFRAAIDAVFSAREAVFNAREAEFRAQGAERAALVERLQALGADTPEREVRRTLSEVDSAWQRLGPAPRNAAAALESRFRDARDAARSLLAGSARRQWQAHCDGLLARIELDAAQEQVTDPGAAPDGVHTEAGPSALPPAWEQALARRALHAGRGAAAGPPIDEALLQLESALQLESPPAFQAARRELKLRALKSALDSRAAAAPAARSPQAWLAVALEHAPLAESQRQRLLAIVAAWRERGPDGAP